MWVGISGQHGTESGGPLVALKSCVIRRYYLVEGDLLSTLGQKACKNRVETMKLHNLESINPRTH